MTDKLWRFRTRTLTKARKAFRKGEAEGLHDVRVALRRIGATAAALGETKIKKQSRSLVRSLSRLRQLEIDRTLLGRLRALDILPEDGASGLDARWGSIHSAGVKKATRLAEGKKIRKLLDRMRRRARRGDSDPANRLRLARRRAERRLIPPSESASDREIHRYRIAVKKARYLAEDLDKEGIPGLESTIAREKELQDALGRWNDVRLFREHLMESRAESEECGAVTLALELDRAILALEGVVASLRRQALEKARGGSRVRSLRARSA